MRKTACPVVWQRWRAQSRHPEPIFGDDLLTDQDGVSKRFFSDWLNGRIVLLNFVFTQCRDACPLLTQKLRSVRQELGNDFGQKVFFLSLTVDPANDTPDKLKAFAQKMHADEAGWRFLTAEPAAMQKVQQRLGQFQAEREQHSTLLLAGNPGRGHWIKIRPDSPVAGIAAKIQLLLNEL